MKKKNRGCLISIGLVVLWLVINMIVFAVSCTSGKIYNNKMSKSIVPYSQNRDTKGTKVTAFDEGTAAFTDKYLPKNAKASRPGEVRYILYYRSDMLTKAERYGISQFYSTKTVTGKVEKLTVRLVDYKTGNTIAANVFQGDPPKTISSDTKSFNVTVSSGKVESWIESSLPNP